MLGRYLQDQEHLLIRHTYLLVYKTVLWQPHCDSTNLKNKLEINKRAFRTLIYLNHIYANESCTNLQEYDG